MPRLLKPTRPRGFFREEYLYDLTGAAFAANPAEVFGKYLGRGMPCYVAKKETEPTPVDAMRVIKGAGGKAVLAHPFYPGETPDFDHKELLEHLVPQGLDGVELIFDYSDSKKPPPADAVEFYVRCVAEEGLIVTGGSDYHGWGPPRNKIDWPVMVDGRFKDLTGKKRRR